MALSGLHARQAARSPADRSRTQPALRPRQRSLVRPPAALGPDSVDVSAAVTELVARSLHNSGGDVSSLLSHLNHALDGSSSLFHAAQHAHASVDTLTASVVPEPAVLQQAAQWTPAPHPSVLTDVAAIAPVLADIGASPNVALAADAASSMAVDAAHASVLALATWASERLDTVQAIDPESYNIMRSTMNDVLTAIQGVIDSQVGNLALGWTNALVLGVQQLVTTLRMTEASGATTSIDAMVAAQQAMQEALSTQAASPMGPGNFGPQIAMAALAFLVAAIPRGSPAPAAAVAGAGAAAGGADGSAFGIPSAPQARNAAYLVPGAGYNPTGATDIDGLPLRYDPKGLDAYFAGRPGTVLKRNAQMFHRVGSFCCVLLWDWRTGQIGPNMPQRAKEAVVIIEDMGPAFIKIAQQLSTRVDLVPPPYLEEFKRLQDNVRTFSTVEAREVLEEGLGCPVDRVFEWLSAEPLAAASLGQVYRGKLRPEHGGAEVAVKVQRPQVLETVALDIFIMRRFVVLLSTLPFMSDQWAVVLDDWGTRFFEEMDYQLEAYNTMTFKKQMASLQGITVATVYPEFTSRKVIVTEWVEGEKLNHSKAEDVRALCSTLLNCYLIQLLETGLLHADPHPGNLLRTADGRIVILDFGLMTEVTEDQRIALVEFIAHLTMEDWSGVSRDLLKLGFMPDGMPPDAEKFIAPVLEQVMGKIVQGGGLRGFNIGSMTSQLQGVAMDYKMCIPPYFGLVLRAFCVIEGIALKTDENYAIVQECMPYLSRRLLTDNNPRMRAALRQLLYGNKNRIDVERLSRMVSAFGSFTTASNTAAQAAGPTFGEAAERAYAERVKGQLAASSPDAPVVNEATREVLKVVFAKDGSYAQELIVEEMVAAVDAMSREALGEALRLVMSSAGAVTALRSVEALGPLRSMLMPLPLPLEVLSAMAPNVTLTAEDRQALAMVRTLLDLLQPSMSRLPDVAANGSRAIRAAGELMPLVPELLPGMRSTLELFIRQLVRRMALRLAEDLSTGSSSSSSSSSAAAGLNSTSSYSSYSSLSSVADFGAMPPNPSGGTGYSSGR
ncbi:hypothetical protein HYH02_000395 [Chlamydomonas schloesseri]|uniref:Protein kinase domain-containing protein n=1 Tax=Chlamydomonas schloesseri TaxID=2026947 RepID=A0A836BDD3_9CHLO|nr:hypothetical protein HYH02_000395 [Chlamydomonas schloesseri]|eukprot:KAG2454550.1 hypothetical protein HYH02_000395 [Chlamydomonas schloesseri]